MDKQVTPNDNEHSKQVVIVINQRKHGAREGVTSYC